MHTVILEYIWLDGHSELRSKYKTVYVDNVNDIRLEKWNYDGSSTNQATTESSEVILKVVATFNHPLLNSIKLLSKVSNI